MSEPARWQASSYADGVPAIRSTAPKAPEDVDPDLFKLPLPSGKAGKVTKRASRIMQFEGPRGYSTRGAVYLRYVAFLLEILLLSAFTQALTNGIPRANGAGMWMLFACTIMLISGALATMRHPNERNKIIKEARHYILGMAVRPGVAVAALIWGTKGLFEDITEDAFAGLVTNALPIVYFCTIFIPAIVFVKFVFGVGQLNRSMEDNQEMVARWTRQDGMQR